jgi:NAD(P)-dependent dehydrogenase (short-subunit alcohol dehydrogenase family)
VASLVSKKALVVGAGRGFGRGVADAFSVAGAHVVAVARTPIPTAGIQKTSRDINFVFADAADPVVAGSLLSTHQPDIVALVGGATPLLRPIHHQTWETFSLNWNVDVRMVFNWLREILLLPLNSGSTVIVTGSIAEQVGSPLSGSYAGSKRTVRFLADNAQQESTRSRLGISVVTVLPTLTPATQLDHEAKGQTNYCTVSCTIPGTSG